MRQKLLKKIREDGQVADEDFIINSLDEISFNLTPMKKSNQSESRERRGDVSGNNPGFDSNAVYNFKM